MRSVAARLLLAVAALGLAALAGHGSEPGGRLELTAADGAMAVANSRHGKAILSADNMRPRQAVSGTVTIANRGHAPARLALISGRPRGLPGPAGGRLRAALRLTIREVTGRRARPIARGTPRAVAGCHALGRLAPGTRRRFRFTATFLSRGSADNRYAGARTKVTERWRLGACTGRRGRSR